MPILPKYRQGFYNKQIVNYNFFSIYLLRMLSLELHPPSSWASLSSVLDIQLSPWLSSHRSAVEWCCVAESPEIIMDAISPTYRRTFSTISFSIHPTKIVSTLTFYPCISPPSSILIHIVLPTVHRFSVLSKSVFTTQKSKLSFPHDFNL